MWHKRLGLIPQNYQLWLQPRAWLFRHSDRIVFITLLHPNVNISLSVWPIVAIAILCAPKVLTAGYGVEWAPLTVGVPLLFLWQRISALCLPAGSSRRRASTLHLKDIEREDRKSRKPRTEVFTVKQLHDHYGDQGCG
jgi:hypothetical protein